MFNKSHTQSLKKCIYFLKKNYVIAYPTETVFGLGCDPDNKIAVMNLLALKKRSINKGFILIAANYAQLLPYISDCNLSSIQRKRMFSYWPGPTTFIVPVSPKTPYWLTGQFNSLAIRVSNHPQVQTLCHKFGKPLISTSANISGQPPCCTVDEIKIQFGMCFPTLLGVTGGRKYPSKIRDAITGIVIR